jgi:hypothetical protein
VRDQHYNRENNEVVEFSDLHEDISKFMFLRKSVVAPGMVRINVNRRLALKDVADAHKALEARATSGSATLAF